MKKRNAFLAVLFSVFISLVFGGCAEKSQRLSETELARLKAYRFPPPPVVATTINGDDLTAAFGGIVPDAKIVERNINGWHKVTISYDYPGGVPDEWEDICTKLADSAAAYKPNTSVELLSNGGALLASASGGNVRYNAFTWITEPNEAFTHDGTLSGVIDGPVYVSAKNAYYHLDGTCAGKPNFMVTIDRAVDESRKPCPQCVLSRFSESSLSVEITLKPLEAAPLSALDFSFLDDLEPITRSEPTSGTVYVSNRTHTIHSIPDCSGMKYYTAMTQSEADAKGYQYCPNCW